MRLALKSADRARATVLGVQQHAKAAHSTQQLRRDRYATMCSASTSLLAVLPLNSASKDVKRDPQKRRPNGSCRVRRPPGAVMLDSAHIKLTRVRKWPRNMQVPHSCAGATFGTLKWPIKLASARSWLPLAPHAEASGKVLTIQRQTSLEVAKGAWLAICLA